MNHCRGSVGARPPDRCRAGCRCGGVCGVGGGGMTTQQVERSRCAAPLLTTSRGRRAAAPSLHELRSHEPMVARDLSPHGPCLTGAGGAVGAKLAEGLRGEHGEVAAHAEEHHDLHAEEHTAEGV